MTEGNQDQKKQSLVQIITDYKSLDELLLESDGEITDNIIEQIVDSWRKELTDKLETKADNYQHRMNMLNAASESLRERSAKISAAAKAIESMSDRLKATLKTAMIESGLSQINGTDFNVKIIKSKPSVVILDERLIPALYSREKIIIEVDKQKIKEAIDGGMNVDGAELRESLSIRSFVNKKIKELN